MVLQAEVALGRLAELEKLRELARRDLGVPVGRAFDILDILGAIHGVDALPGGDNNMEGIPLTGGIRRVDGGSVELVEPAGLLRIGAVNIVLNLDLGSGHPGSLLRFEDVKHQSAVAAFGNIVVELELKRSILLFRKDIAPAFFREGEGAVCDLPLGIDAVLLIIFPLREVLAVEEQGPALRFFRLGEDVQTSRFLVRED